MKPYKLNEYLGKTNILHINLNRYVRRTTHTYTIYSSIVEKDRDYGEVWLDFQGEGTKRRLIGVQIIWEGHESSSKNKKRRNSNSRTVRTTSRSRKRS